MVISLKLQLAKKNVNRNISQMLSVQWQYEPLVEKGPDKKPALSSLWFFLSYVQLSYFILYIIHFYNKNI